MRPVLIGIIGISMWPLLVAQKTVLFFSGDEPATHTANRPIFRHRSSSFSYSPARRSRACVPLHVASQGKGLATALRSHLPARLLQLPRSWGSLLLPSGSGGTGRPSLPTLRKLGSVRSMGDLRRELAAAGVAARATAAKPAGEEHGAASAGAGHLALEKTGGKGELSDGKAAQKGEAAQAVAVVVAAGSRAGAAKVEGSAAAEGTASVPAKVPVGPTGDGGSPEGGRPADAAAVSTDGSSARSGDKLLAAGDGAAAGAGGDGASLTSETLGGGRRRSLPSRKRRSAGSQPAEDGDSSSMSRSSAPVLAGSPPGLEVNAGTLTTVTDVKTMHPHWAPLLCSKRREATRPQNIAPRHRMSHVVVFMYKPRHVFLYPRGVSSHVVAMSVYRCFSRQLRQVLEGSAGTASGEKGGQHSRVGGASSPLALTAVASLDEQVRGLGVRAHGRRSLGRGGGKEAKNVRMF